MVLVVIVVYPLWPEGEPLWSLRLRFSVSLGLLCLANGTEIPADGDMGPCMSRLRPWFTCRYCVRQESDPAIYIVLVVIVVSAFALRSGNQPELPEGKVANPRVGWPCLHSRVGCPTVRLRSGQARDRQTDCKRPARCVRRARVRASPGQTAVSDFRDRSRRLLPGRSVRREAMPARYATADVPRLSCNRSGCGQPRARPRSR